MIQFDRYTKVILTVIAAVLLALLWRSGGDLGMASTAHADTKTSKTIDVVLVKDIPIENFKEVILLGDQKTFLIRVDKGIGVYQVREY